jgi:hypothetical protein
MTTDQPAPDQHRAALDAIGARHAANQAEAAAIAAAAAAAIAAATRAGLTPQEIHRRTGYSRQRILDIRKAVDLDIPTTWSRVKIQA